MTLTFMFLKSFIIILAFSAGIAYLFARFLKYKYVGKIYGGIAVAFLGAMVFNSVLEPFILFFKNYFNVNILSVILGAVLFVNILNRATPKSGE